MCTRKTQLVDLPTDVLARILAVGSASYMVVALWKCGNALLNYRLANGGCDTVVLIDRNWTSTSRWPMMLRSLAHLRVLKIIRDGYIMPVHLLSLELRQLAPTLERLEIECYGAESCLLNYSAESTAESSVFESTMTLKGSSRLWNIGALYPRLQHLRIWVPNKMGCYGFDLNDLVVLPEEILSISMNICFDRGDLSLLPRYLESITTGISNRPFEGDISQLPPYLTCLDGFNCDVDDVATLAQYPRTLRNCEAFFSMSVFEPEMAAALPPALQTLDCCEFFEIEAFEPIISPWPLALPQTLTKLQLSTISGEAVLNRCAITALPQTLLEIWNLEVDWSSLDNAMDDGKSDSGFWPPHLHTIQFLEGHPSIQSASDLRHLPYHLKRLLSLEVATGFEFTRPFPPFLRELEIIGVDILFFHALPESLESIKCRGDFDFRHVGNFPPSLCNAELLLCPGRGANKERFNFQMLPTQLSHLTVTCCSTNCLAELPRSVTWLTIIDLIGQPSPDTFSRMPPNLTYLCIGQMLYDRSNCCTNLAFASLPPTLRTLRITHAVLPGSTLRFLPRNIRDLGLKFASLSAEDLKRMPLSQLRSFTPYELTAIPDIEPDVVRYWPETPLTLSEMDLDQPPPILDNIRTKNGLLRSRNLQFPDPRVIHPH